MKKQTATRLLFMLLPLLVVSATAAGQTRYETGRITPQELDSLLTYFPPKKKMAAIDTLMIKYEFNGETCWTSKPKSISMESSH